MMRHPYLQDAGHYRTLCHALGALQFRISILCNCGHVMRCFATPKTKVRGFDSMDPCHRDANTFQNAIDNTWPLKMQVQKAVLLGTVRHGPWLGGAFGQQLRELWNLLIQSIATNSTSFIVVQNMRAGIAFDRRLRLDDMPENILEMIPSNPFKLGGQYVTSSNSHSTCM